MTDHARLRRMCAAQTDIPRGDVLALLDEFERVGHWQQEVAIAAGIADDLRGEGRGVYLETDPERAAEAVAALQEAARDHTDCPVLCDEDHDERWEWPLSCPECRGSGLAGPSSAYWGDGPIPNTLAHPGECEACAGDGRDHYSPGNLVPISDLGHLRDQLLALEVAARGYRERAERAEETMLLAVRRADRLAAQIDRMRQDAEDDRDDNAHAARPVALREPRTPGAALGDTPAPDRAATGIVTAAHYGRMA